MPRPDARLDGEPISSEAAALKYLPSDLIAILASLHNLPRSWANATIQLLPFGSRSALECLNPPLAIPGPPTAAPDGHRTLVLTEFAFEVIAEAHASAEASPEEVSDWVAQADEIARIAAGRRPK